MKGFWNRWKKDYLLQLRTAHKSPKGDTQTLVKNDVGIVEDVTRPKLLWDLGRIVETLPGKDGHVRACVVNMGNETLVRRPVEKLYHLEINKIRS